MPAYRWARLFATLGLVACPVALAAQSSPPHGAPHHASVSPASAGVAQVPAVGPGLEVHGLVLGGVTVSGAGMTSPDSVHFAGGGILQVAVRAVGVLGLGMIGRGAEYESTLVGGGLSLRVLEAGPFELTGFAGYGRYAEEGWTGIRREASGPLFGGLVVLRVGRLAIGVVVTDLSGRYEGTDVREPFGFHVPRISLGLGF